MPTTFRDIRQGFITAIKAIVPATMSSDRFRLAPSDEQLATVAADEARMPSLFRLFTIRDNHDDAPTGYTDLHTVRVNHTFTLDVAYPKLLGKYGRDDLLSMDDVIRQDFHAIDRTIGIVGADNWQPAQAMSDHQGGLVIDVGPALIRRAIYRIEYDTELQP